MDNNFQKVEIWNVPKKHAIERIRKRFGKRKHSVIAFGKNDDKNKKWILETLIRDSSRNERGQYLAGLFSILLVVLVGGILTIKSEFASFMRGLFEISLVPGLPAVSFFIGLVVFVMISLVIIVSIFTAFSFSWNAIFHTSVVSPDDIKALFDNMKNEWYVVFMERRSLFLHHFNDVEVIVLESRSRSPRRTAAV